MVQRAETAQRPPIDAEALEVAGSMIEHVASLKRQALDYQWTGEEIKWYAEGMDKVVNAFLAQVKNGIPLTDVSVRLEWFGGKDEPSMITDAFRNPRAESVRRQTGTGMATRYYEVSPSRFPGLSVQRERITGHSTGYSLVGTNRKWQ